MSRSSRCRGGWWRRAQVRALLLALLLPCMSPLLAQDSPADDPAGGTPKSDKPLNLDLSFLWDSRGQGEPSWIVAKVNNEIVTRGEVLNRILPELEGLVRSYPAEQFQRKAVERWRRTVKEIVEEKLLLQIAKTEEITVSEAEIDKALAEETKKSGGQAKFEQNLVQMGMTPTKYRERIARELTMREVILRKIGAKGSLNVMAATRMPKDIYVPPAEIRAFYDAHKKDYYIEEKVQPRQIILKFRDSESRSVAEQEGRSLLKLLEAGADFALLAHWTSAVLSNQDGLSQEAGRGTYPEDVEKVLFSLKPGETSPLLESEGTFRIMKVESRTQSQQKTFEDVQEEIKKHLQNKRVMDNVEDVKRELKKGAYIWPPELAK
ncbi:MAG: peptidyl-prolyl cis-trans isomerase [Planctomycetes bacterium]|nr:peptidyl-prolyl cis-trans isomerase [Planctomycetota bacterium]